MGFFCEEGSLKEEELASKLFDRSFPMVRASFRGIKLKAFSLFWLVHVLVYFLGFYVPSMKLYEFDEL